MVHPLSLGLLVVLTGAAAVADVRTGRIPNRLVLSGLVASIASRVVLACLSEGSFVELARQLAAAGAGLIVCGLPALLLYRAGGMGGGDVKLLAAVGALVGPSLGVQTLFCAMALASLQGLVLALARGQLGSLLAASGKAARRLARPEQRPPPVQERMTALRFGPALLVSATILSFLYLPASSSGRGARAGTGWFAAGGVARSHAQTPAAPSGVAPSPGRSL